MKNFLFLISIIFLFSCNKNGTDTAKRPFPQHVNYKANHLKPSLNTAELDQLVINYYKNWKALYLKSCNGTYYIDYTDENPNIITVSEAHGYGMMIFAYMAGVEPEAQKIFDGFFRYYKNHPSLICSQFMDWEQNRSCQSVGGSSATDGDLDVAFALLLADKQWGSNGKINYRQEALKIINALKTCVFSTDGYPLLGDWVNDSQEDIYMTATRSSDWIVDHFQAFYHATGDTFWRQAVNEIINLTRQIQNNYSPTTGLIPDFITSASNSPQPAYANFLESQYDGQLYFNACRTPWRLTSGQLFLDDTLLLTEINKINSWIIQKTSGQASKIKAGYYLDGREIHQFPDISFTGGFAVAAMVSDNQAWLDSCFNSLMQPDIGQYAYYANTLRMLYLLVLSGNYWLP